MVARRTEAGRTAPQALGERGGLRATAEQPPGGERRGVELDPKSRTQPPSSGDCAQVLVQLPSKEMGAEADSQVAAPAEMRTPNWHRATIAQPKSADGRMATEAARLKGEKAPGRKKQNHLDTNRPSHGGTWQAARNKREGLGV